MKNSYPEIRNTIFKFCSNIDTEDFIKFHLFRLAYETPEILVELYNREVDIGNTGEKLQTMYFIIFHKLFMRSFGKSPIILEDKTCRIKVTGKINLTNHGFELQNHNSTFLKLV